MKIKKPPAFGPTQRLEKEYASGIGKIVGKVLKPKKPGQTLEEWLAELAERSRAADVREASEWLAVNMVRWANVGNQHTWREAAARSQQSAKLYRLLEREMAGPVGTRVRQLVRENAELIGSLPLKAATDLVDEIRAAQQRGARPGTIDKMARARFPQLLRSRVHLISRTETAKTSAALTQARCEELDVRWYLWETSSDSRVRRSHKKMNNVLVPWAHAPSPEALVGEKSTLGHYHAGMCPNCRCTQIPLLTFQDTSWPHAVYWGGRVQQMTLVKFRQLAQGGVEERAA